MIEIFILSVIQGVAEFLPVSSSSHLILISEYLNFKDQSLSVDVSLHVGSFIAVLSYFYKDIINFYQNKILFFRIFVSSLPIMIVGFLLVETNYLQKIRNIEVIAWTTILFGIFLYVSDKFQLNKNINNNFGLKEALFIGILQIFSLMPGVSRSGIAITAARLLDFNRFDSAKISFLLSIPILGAVSIYGIKDFLIYEYNEFTKVNLIAIFFSFVFSFITIKYFLKFIKKFSLNVFVLYRIFLGITLLILSYL
jgi:undecaprenyl-diphosphatase